MSYKDYTIVITLVCWPKRMIFGAETHLSGGVMYECFCLLSTAIAQVPCLAGSTALRKGLWKLWIIHCHNYRRILMLTCQNLPWWRHECCNNFFFPSGCDAVHLTPTARSSCNVHKLEWAICWPCRIIQAAFEQDLSLSWWMQTESAQSSARSE